MPSVFSLHSIDSHSSFNSSVKSVRTDEDEGPPCCTRNFSCKGINQLGSDFCFREEGRYVDSFSN